MNDSSGQWRTETDSYSDSDIRSWPIHQTDTNTERNANMDTDINCFEYEYEIELDMDTNRKFREATQT